MGTPRLPIACRLRGLFRLGLLQAAVLAGALLSAGLAAAQPLQPGEGYVTRFSGVLFGASGPIIDLNGTVGSIIDVRAPGQAPQGTHWLYEPQRSPVTAGQVGQVFGVVLDDANPPNVYLAATSAFGLHRTPDNTQWMAGMWGSQGSGPSKPEGLKDAHAPEISPGPYVLLTVTDTGSGMDANTASRIFEPFFTTKEVGRGTGLGLSTVHGIVKQSDGHIAVESEPGHGTTFRIHFPKVSAGEAASKSAVRQSQPARGTETVVVVDDDSSLLGLVSEILKLHGYTVIEVANGETVLTMLENDGAAIDAVITDVVMPKLNGRELVRRAIKIRPNLPIVLMSGYVGENVEALGSLLGPRVAFIQKPFTPEALLEKLRDVLRGSAAGVP